MPRLADVVQAMDEWFDPSWAEAWDAVGLVCGDPAEPVQRVLLAVDPVAATVGEALGIGAQLLITHHPLLLTPVHGVPADDIRGGLVHQMIRGGVAHLVAHTNADVADPGVSDALAGLFALQRTVPIVTAAQPSPVKVVVFVPSGHAAAVLDAMAVAGAGAIGAYDRCAWTVEGHGTFRPLAGASPAIGTIGEVSEVTESRIEMVVPTTRLAEVVAAMRAAHPYEEPAFDLLAQVAQPTTRGSGRIGELPEPTTLRALTQRAAAVLPRTAWGVRAAGDPDAPVRSMAVCGGSGGSYAEAARAAGADVLLTADLKHHVTSDAVADGLALIDAAHWATEAPWLDAVAGRIREEFGTSVEVHVSRRVTDPWTVHAQTEVSTPPS